MNSQTKKLVILFADISDSTALYDNLGDERALQLVVRCLTSLSEQAVAHGGILVKTIGDEIMCSFPTAEAALGAAKEMQRVIKKSNGASETPVHVRIGFHIGEVMCEEADMYGETVNVAARVTAITRADQIMTTRDVVDALPIVRGGVVLVEVAEVTTPRDDVGPDDGLDQERDARRLVLSVAALHELKVGAGQSEAFGG